MASTNSKRKNQMLRKYGRQCVWCSVELSNAAATVDHIRCRTAGGSNWIGNLLPACVSCNAERGRMPVRLWLAKCLAAQKLVKLSLVNEAINRLDCERSHKIGDCIYQLQQQRVRQYNWHSKEAIDALWNMNYVC